MLSSFNNPLSCYTTYMKTINVSAAVIIRKNPLTQKSEVLATQRGYGDYKDWWEFPGGKIKKLL